MTTFSNEMHGYEQISRLSVLENNQNVSNFVLLFAQGFLKICYCVLFINESALLQIKCTQDTVLYLAL